MAALAGCGPKRSVTRVAPGSAPELSGDWSAVDAKETSDALIKDCFTKPWLSKFTDEQGRSPRIRVRKIVNKTDEHIDAQVFIANIEEAMVNSGKVEVLAQKGAELDSVNEEEDYAVEGRVGEGPSIGDQLGADYAVAVSMRTILDQADGKRVKYYKINFQLLDANSGSKVWIGNHEIQKMIKQARADW